MVTYHLDYISRFSVGSEGKALISLVGELTYRWNLDENQFKFNEPFRNLKFRKHWWSDNFLLIQTLKSVTAFFTFFNGLTRTNWGPS